MFHIDITTEGDLSSFPLEPIKDAISSTLEHLLSLDSNGATEVSVLLTNDPTIQELNRNWRLEDSPTDVLSFPNDPPDFLRNLPDPNLSIPWSLGDIAISLDSALANVQSAVHQLRIQHSLLSFPPSPPHPRALHLLENWNLPEESQFLVIHSYLHLLGWDHDTPDNDSSMRLKEVELWLSSL